MAARQGLDDDDDDQLTNHISEGYLKEISFTTQYAKSR